MAVAHARLLVARTLNVGDVWVKLMAAQAHIMRDTVADQIVYKVMLAEQFAQFQRDGVFHGAPVDIADGYIHLSCAYQLAETLDKHFSGVAGLMLVAVDLSRLGDTVRWEPSRRGQLFPHIHGVLPVEAVVAVGPVERTDDGGVVLPG